MLNKNIRAKQEGAEAISNISDAELTTIYPNDTPANDVIAYRYQVTVGENASEFIYGGHDIVEYYIPSLKLFFNERAVGQSECPRNHTGFECTSPLTKVSLSRLLVDIIESAFDAHKDDELHHRRYDTYPELENAEIKLLTVNHISIQEGIVNRVVEARFLQEEKDFERGYEAFGNDALLPYMLSSVHGNIPSQHTIDRIISIIKEMDSSEKESLKASFEEHLENLSDESSYSLPLYAGLGVMGGALALTKKPLVGFAAGIFAGGLTFFKQSHNQSQRAHIHDRFLEELKEQLPNLTK